MNKKIIMLISAFVCANNMVFAAQKGPIKVSQDNIIPIAEHLTTEENKIYQALIVKFQTKKLTAADNTATNIGILKKQEVVLVQSMQVSNKSPMWPYWLGASLLPVARGISSVGRTMADIGLPLPGTTYYYGRYEIGYEVRSTPLDFPINMLYKIVDYLPLGPVGNLLIYNALPLMAFYVIYKQYNSMQSQQQELEMVRNILATLKSFGEPS